MVVKKVGVFAPAPIIGQGLAAMSQKCGFDVVGGDVYDALELSLDCDVLVVSSPVPEVCEKLGSAANMLRLPPVVFMTGAFLPGFAVQTLRKVGVEAILSLDTVQTLFQVAVNSVANGNSFFDYSVVAHAIEAQTASDSRRLTARERELLQMVIEGVTNREMAARISLSVRTVETHRRNLMSKLAARNAGDLVAKALHLGIVQPLQLARTAA